MATLAVGTSLAWRLWRVLYHDSGSAQDITLGGTQPGYDSPGFDDSAWEAPGDATIAAWNSSPVGSGIALAPVHAIDSTTNNGLIWLGRKAFLVPGTVTAASVTISGDDSVSVYLNGTLLGSGSYLGVGGGAVSAALFRPGENVLAFQATNGGGGWPLDGYGAPKPASGGNPTWAAAELSVTYTPFPTPITDGISGPVGTSWLPGLVIEYFSNDGSTFGPATLQGVIREAINVGWSWYSRFPANAFFTLRKGSIHNARLQPLLTHIRIWYYNPATGYQVLVFTGRLTEPNNNANDTVWTAWNYLAELSLSRTGYRTLYPNKLIGTEIALPEWTAARTATYSPLNFVTTGTVENPLGSDNVTPITTDARFGVIDVPRLLLMFDLSEIGRANTIHNTTFAITRVPPHSFSFLKDAGTLRTGRRLTFPGEIRGYSFIPGFASLRNDLATIGSSTDGSTVEIVKTDEANAAIYGRRQDVFQIKTLAGQVGGATESDAQNAITARAVKEATNLAKSLSLELRPFAFEPFDGWDIEDTIRVQIPDENIDQVYRIIGVRGLQNARGYHPQLIVKLPTAA